MNTSYLQLKTKQDYIVSYFILLFLLFSLNYVLNTNFVYVIPIIVLYFNPKNLENKLYSYLHQKNKKYIV